MTVLAWWFAGFAFVLGSLAWSLSMEGPARRARNGRELAIAVLVAGTMAALWPIAIVVGIVMVCREGSEP